MNKETLNKIKEHLDELERGYKHNTMATCLGDMLEGVSPLLEKGEINFSLSALKKLFKSVFNEELVVMKESNGDDLAFDFMASDMKLGRIELKSPKKEKSSDNKENTSLTEEELRTAADAIRKLMRKKRI